MSTKFWNKYFSNPIAYELNKRSICKRGCVLWMGRTRYNQPIWFNTLEKKDHYLKPWLTKKLNIKNQFNCENQLCIKPTHLKINNSWPIETIKTIKDLINQGYNLTYLSKYYSISLYRLRKIKNDNHCSS